VATALEVVTGGVLSGIASTMNVADLVGVSTLLMLSTDQNWIVWVALPHAGAGTVMTVPVVCVPESIL